MATTFKSISNMERELLLLEPLLASITINTFCQEQMHPLSLNVLVTMMN